MLQVISNLDRELPMLVNSLNGVAQIAIALRSRCYSPDATLKCLLLKPQPEPLLLLSLPSMRCHYRYCWVRCYKPLLLSMRSFCVRVFNCPGMDLPIVALSWV